MSEESLYVRPLEAQDIPKVMDLLVQVNLVHYNGRPDIFKKDTKFTEEDVEHNFVASEMNPVFVCVEVVDHSTDAVVDHRVCHHDVVVHHTASLCRDVSEDTVDDAVGDTEVEGVLGEGLAGSLHRELLDAEFLGDGGEVLCDAVSC